MMSEQIYSFVSLVLLAGVLSVDVLSDFVTDFSADSLCFSFFLRDECFCPEGDWLSVE